MNDCRPLTAEEYALVRWMLEHGSPDATAFLEQLEQAEVTPWKCDCGCASINFRIAGRPEPPPGVHVLADFEFGDEHNLSGIFVFEKEGTLRGVEVYGCTGDAPKTLPSPHELRPIDGAAGA